MDIPAFSVVFTGGEAPAPGRCRALAAGAAFIAAADSGLIACEDAGLRAGLIVGDMDSLREAGEETRLTRYPPECIKRYPRDKDFTDTELALEALREKGAAFIRLIGGGGGRLDHLLAIRELFERPFCPVTWHTKTEDIYTLDGKNGTGLCAEFNTRRGGTVSLLPAGNGPWNIESAGLQWPVTNLAWKRGVFGICNRAVTGGFSLTVYAGRFLMVLPA